MTQEERGAVQRWKDANGYDDILAAYSATVDERNALTTQLDDAKQVIVTLRATMEQMRRERDEARAHAEERTAKVRDLARCAAASEARARAYAAKLARIREVAECDYHDTPRTVLRIIAECEGDHLDAWTAVDAAIEAVRKGER
jgi:chromosome segregation ATPase